MQHAQKTLTQIYYPPVLPTILAERAGALWGPLKNTNCKKLEVDNIIPAAHDPHWLSLLAWSRWICRIQLTSGSWDVTVGVKGIELLETNLVIS